MCLVEDVVNEVFDQFLALDIVLALAILVVAIVDVPATRASVHLNDVRLAIVNDMVDSDIVALTNPCGPLHQLYFLVRKLERPAL